MKRGIIVEGNEYKAEIGRVAPPFGFALTDPYVRLSRIRLFPKVTRNERHAVQG
jgi:hypothetical protein